MFQKIKASRICDTVVKDIEEAAISGQLKPGDKLPAERVLSESLAFLSHFHQYLTSHSKILEIGRNLIRKPHVKFKS